MCKKGLKDTCFSVSLNQKSQKLVSFKWRNLFYQYLGHSSGFGPATRILTKLMRIPISLLRKLYVQPIIFLDNISLLIVSVPSTREKKEDCQQCQDPLGKLSDSIMELSQLIVHLPSTEIAALPAPLQYRVMQRQQILELQEKGDYNLNITLSAEAKTKLDW